MGITISESQEMRRLQIRREARMKTQPSSSPFLNQQPYTSGFMRVGQEHRINDGQRLTKTATNKYVEGSMSYRNDPKAAKQIDIQNIQIQETSEETKQMKSKPKHETIFYDQDQSAKIKRQNIQKKGEKRQTSARGKKIKISKH